ncbi:MAG TPA: hypothetical protein VM782_08495 [Stellaceae bacterium]|nr:hypothetical protein [Stellaceae bacterium]
MENFSKRTIVSLLAGFFLTWLVCGFILVQLGEATPPAVHCDRHLHFVTEGKAA